MNVDGWQTWSKHVLKEIERLDASLQRVEAMLHLTREDIATLKVKSGIWGAVGASIPIAVALVIMLLKGSLFK